MKILFALFCGISTLAFASEPAVKTIEGTVIAVADGDTLTILDDDNNSFKIRLDGIDAPEKKQPFGTEAKRALSDAVKDQRVTVRWKTRDKYQRVIGEVTVEGRSINQQLVEDGHAWHYKKYSRSEVLEKGEEDARRDRKGLWRDNSPLPPWDFRTIARKAGR